MFEQIIRVQAANSKADYYLGLCNMQMHRDAQARNVFLLIAERFPETEADTLAKQALDILKPTKSVPLV